MKGKVMAKSIMSNKVVRGRKIRIKDIPLKEQVAKLIIETECFGNMEKQDILDKVKEVHKDHDGQETSESQIRGSVTGALRKLVKEGKAENPFTGTYYFPIEEIEENGKGTVYLFYYPAYKALAEEKGQEFWQCKIGMTVDNVEKRVGHQTTGNPEEAIALEFKTDRPRELESALHAILKLRGRHVTEGGGVEWFKTNPDEVTRIYHFLTSLQSTGE